MKLRATKSLPTLLTVESSCSTNVPYVSNTVASYGILTYGHDIGLSAGEVTILVEVADGFAGGGFAQVLASEQVSWA